jgi:hypothetical protein
VHFHHPAGTLQLAAQVLPRRQQVLKPQSGRFRFSLPHARCAYFSLSFLPILPFRYRFSSRIVYLIYAPTLPARTLRPRTQYVLLHPNIFILFSRVLCLSVIRQPSFCILPNISGLFVRFYILYPLRTQAQIYLALRSREAGSLEAARQTIDIYIGSQKAYPRRLWLPRNPLIALGSHSEGSESGNLLPTDVLYMY